MLQAQQQARAKALRKAQVGRRPAQSALAELTAEHLQAVALSPGRLTKVRPAWSCPAAHLALRNHPSVRVLRTHTQPGCSHLAAPLPGDADPCPGPRR